MGGQGERSPSRRYVWLGPGLYSAGDAYRSGCSGRLQHRTPTLAGAAL